MKRMVEMAHRRSDHDRVHWVAHLETTLSTHLGSGNESLHQILELAAAISRADAIDEEHFREICAPSKDAGYRRNSGS